jgi:hypothetical protein
LLQLFAQDSPGFLLGGFLPFRSAVGAVRHQGHLLEELLPELITADTPTAGWQLLNALCLLACATGFHGESKLLASGRYGWPVAF